MQKHKLIRSISYFAMTGLLAFVMVKCANPVSPSGGPKDETPPVVISSEPENYSANFSDREMKIDFNEFIQLKSLQQQMLISPPMENMPEIKIKKKSVIIELHEDEQLNENTTYTIFIGNAVVDLTESNPYPNFEYVFSTGSFVDSLSLKGIVKNTFSGLPAENVSVMLYADENDTIPLDSLPLRIRPSYVAKTDKEGNFSLHNLRNLPYKIFALNDQNSNYLYDLPYEEIAFGDSMVYPYYTGSRTIAVIDSAAMDSILLVEYDYTPTELYMFSAIDSTQDIAEHGLLDNYKIQILLDFPCENYTLNPLNFDSTLDWKIDEPNARNDSILAWIKPVVPDTIQIEFIADGIILDTLEFSVKKPEKKSGRKNKGSSKKAKGKDGVDTLAVKIVPLKVVSNLIQNTAELGQKIKLDFDYPLEQYDFSSFIWIEDDSISSIPDVFFSDSSKRHLIINKNLVEKVKYKLIIPDSTLFNIHGKLNDSLIYTFSTKNKDEYGNLVFTIVPDQFDIPWIVQLLDDNDVVLKEKTITKEGIIRFENMNPGNYKLRAILDENENGYWDTGNYAYKRQAERIIYLGAEIELRANWDFEESWELK